MSPQSFSDKKVVRLRDTTRNPIHTVVSDSHNLGVANVLEISSPVPARSSAASAVMERQDSFATAGLRATAVRQHSGGQARRGELAMKLAGRLMPSGGDKTISSGWAALGAIASAPSLHVALTYPVPGVRRTADHLTALGSPTFREENVYCQLVYPRVVVPRGDHLRCDHSDELLKFFLGCPSESTLLDYCSCGFSIRTYQADCDCRGRLLCCFIVICNTVESIDFYALNVIRRRNQNSSFGSFPCGHMKQLLRVNDDAIPHACNIQQVPLDPQSLYVLRMREAKFDPAGDLLDSSLGYSNSLTERAQERSAPNWKIVYRKKVELLIKGFKIAATAILNIFAHPLLFSDRACKAVREQPDIIVDTSKNFGQARLNLSASLCIRSLNVPNRQISRAREGKYRPDCGNPRRQLARTQIPDALQEGKQQNKRPKRNAENNQDQGGFISLVPIDPLQLYECLSGVFLRMPRRALTVQRGDG